ncbi:MAG: hypothetical protein KGL39_52775 [Patescibacteria group bacterium]|nr:hypothetical protein [Patescibacteria group bacterium]
MKNKSGNNYPMSLTQDQIKEKILARESFWVGTQSERVTASRIAKILGIKYTTGRNDPTGFYVCHLPKIKRNSH